MKNEIKSSDLDGVDFEDISSFSNLSINYIKNKNIWNISYILLDIIITPLIYLIIFLILLVPITYIFKDTDVIKQYPTSNSKKFIYTTKKKLLISLEIIAELILSVIAILLAHTIVNKINIFSINNKDHSAILGFLKLIYTAIAMTGVQVILQNKFEYIFGYGHSPGLI